MDLRSLTPDKIVAMLDKHVHGQTSAKEALALAIRNRWRRQQLPAELRSYVKKQNLLLKGPTGSGKTALLRAVELELGWPVHFVDITQYSETGYKGKDLENIIKNFVNNYSDKPLPTWYIDELNNVDHSVNVSSNTAKKRIKDHDHAELSELVCRAMWIHICTEHENIPYPSGNPLVKIDGATITLRDYVSQVRDDVSELARMVCRYRIACLLVPALTDRNCNHITDEQLEQVRVNVFPYPPEMAERLSDDCGEPIKNEDQYVQSTCGYYDRLLAGSIINQFQVEEFKFLSQNSGAYAIWYLWASVMYDDLTRTDAWSDVRNLKHIQNKRLNVKTRARIKKLYEFEDGAVESAQTLKDIFVLALDRDMREEQTMSPFNRTISFIKESVSRRMLSPSWTGHSPHKGIVSRSKESLTVDQKEAWKDENSFSKYIILHSKPMRKLTRETMKDYTLKRHPQAVWDDYFNVLTSLAYRLSELSRDVMTTFVGGKPKVNKTEHTARIQHWNDRGIDMEAILRGMYANMGVPDKDMPGASREDVVKFIQSYGICFLDEFDKIGTDPGQSMITRDGVQRSLLAMVEGAEYPIGADSKLTDAIEYTFDTKSLMFVAAGAFNVTKLDAIIPELRGRFPVVANIVPLTKDNYVSILKLEHSHLNCAQLLVDVENVRVVVEESGYKAMAEIAMQLNSDTNLGARRLETVVDHVFHAPMMYPEAFRESGFTLSSDYVYALDWKDVGLTLKFDEGDDNRPVTVQ